VRVRVRDNSGTEFRNWVETELHAIPGIPSNSGIPGIASNSGIPGIASNSGIARNSRNLMELGQ
jgi:hypothetical protein